MTDNSYDPYGPQGKKTDFEELYRKYVENTNSHSNNESDNNDMTNYTNTQHNAQEEDAYNTLSHQVNTDAAKSFFQTSDSIQIVAKPAQTSPKPIANDNVSHDELLSSTPKQNEHSNTQDLPNYNSIQNPQTEPSANEPKKPEFDEIAAMTTNITSTPSTGAKTSAIQPGISQSQTTAPVQPSTITSSAEAKTYPKSILSQLIAVSLITALVVVGVLYGLYKNGIINLSQSQSSLNSVTNIDSQRTQTALNSDTTTPEWQKVFATVAPSVVSIQVVNGQTGDLGSGFIIGSEGYILTNNHVVSAAAVNTAQILVTLTDGSVHSAKIKGTDSISDIAVIQLENAPKDLKPVQFGDSDKVIVGDSVMAVGNPLGLSNTATTGVVSALDRPVAAASDESGLSNTLIGSSALTVTNALQIDASINPGNSGGPLFDASGNVIGITSSIAQTSSSSGSIGLGFAIPSKLANRLAQEIIKTGKATHVSLGVSIADDSVKVGDVTKKAASVKSITEDGVAQKAGLKTGDFIVSVDNKPVTSTYSLMGYIRELALGTKATIGYVRDNKVYTVDVLFNKEREDEPVQTTPQQDSNDGGSNYWDPWGFGDDGSDK